MLDLLVCNAAGAQAAVIGCAGFAAFSYAIDKFLMHRD